ncbi:MAG: DUF3825 domain-containing protein, partial [Eggerthellaceae bacterium]|nr:DUF3825 domain-containing protein [Eggerthellaceae bacterium]
APPRYFDSRSAMVWDLDYSGSNRPDIPYFDDNHILITRCERIPLEFFDDAKQYSATLASILDNADSDENAKYSQIKSFFTPIITDNASDEIRSAYKTLYDKLKSCIDQAVRKLSWNWRSVVPAYNPSKRNGGPCFLLPVSFCDHTKPADRALIATANRLPTGKTNYQIHTVLPLNWAYQNARVVCRPDTEWLSLASMAQND